MTHHGIVHIEIPTSDQETSNAFFNTVFGWEMTTAGGGMDYHMWNPGENAGPAGGFVSVGDEVKPGDVIIYINTDDIPATLAKIEANGGKTLQPEMEIPGFGSLAVFTDPTGNRLALWKNAHDGS